MFCGDLNAAPINAVHELVTTGKVKATHADWYSGSCIRITGTQVHVLKQLALMYLCLNVSPANALHEVVLAGKVKATRADWYVCLINWYLHVYVGPCA